MRRLNATSEQVRALEASNKHQEEHQVKVESKDIRGSAVQISGVPLTAESKSQPTRDVTQDSLHFLTLSQVPNYLFHPK